MKTPNEKETDKRISSLLSAADRQANEPDKQFIDKLQAKSTAEFLAFSTDGNRHSKRTIPISMWRIIMKSRITKPAAAAMIVVAVLIGVHWFGAGAPAYGITEALELWNNAETVHIKGWKFLHTGDDTQLEKFPFDIWFDKRNGRFKHWGPLFTAYKTETPRYGLTVSDGQYIMDSFAYINMDTSGYINSDDNSVPPSVRFTKLSPFQQRLRIRTMNPFPAYFANLNQVKGFTKVGREQIKNKTVDIWEGVNITASHLFSSKKKIWLSPETGEIVRIFTWRNAGKNSVRWVALSDADTIEYDVVPPANCFNTYPPAGHKQTNTKETVVERELGLFRGADPRFHSCVGFTLKDGSVIYGWHANNEPNESQAHLFTDLEPGGPLPNLPATVDGLKPWPAEEGITLAGRHLTFTRKNGRFYEWGIYVSDEKVPERNTFGTYRIISKCNFANIGIGNVGQELTINSEQEFDIWVRGAMAELSDDGKAPESVTHKNVLQLAEKLRNSLSK
ncbi:MAG: hypothetical protein CEE38_04790 [Planctomycetes bacterium B3_Pla]|nr:MAG: hypothetical protein CEE38_04790 [Planctomycetes bacterium B3_Pla]